jgi:ribosomal protein S27AE
MSERSDTTTTTEVFGTARKQCSACACARHQDRRYCRECGGKGYIEQITRPANCTHTLPECPVEYDPMVHGWECSRCGGSGPA